MDPKQRAAEAALSWIEPGMRIGLGTGSTADYFLKALGDAIADGRVKDVVGVPTSRQSQVRAEGLKIPLSTLEAGPMLDVTVDGADEFDPDLNLIKGLGGALVREKVVAQNSKKLVIIADASKQVTRLGEKVSLPVEVVPFAHEVQERFFRSLNSVPVLRKVNGKDFMTDNGNVIYDCRFEKKFDPVTLERQILDRAGVVGCGFFLGMATAVIMGTETDVTVFQRDDRSRR